MRFTLSILVVLIVTPLFLAPDVLAPDAMAGDEIYRWVDENGVVHFGDQQPANTDAEQVIIEQGISNETLPSADPALADPGQPPVSEPSYAQQLREERAQKRATAEENKKIMAEACAERQMIVSSLEFTPRINVIAEDGTERRMDDNVRVEKVDEAKSFIAKNCNN